ncbi:AraC family transcriptional regulator [Soonwooa sp.]|uniref:AraC family transcriptional regulator n=1 Tax=Soonwooa sp. TaxID=1938592 RepID=UPI00289D6BBD|nr:AraC family transcriptional regulator [Soonwooa sp.]
MGKSHYDELEEADASFYVYHLLTGNVETKKHSHHSAQLIYAEGGIIHIFTEEKHWYLPARCFMWIPAGLPHYILSYSSKVSLFNFYFKPEKEEDDFFSEVNIYSVSHLMREMILFTKNWSGKVTEADQQKYFFLKAMKYILPTSRDRKLAFPVRHPFPKDEILLKIAKFLNTNLDKNLGLEEVAKNFGVSSRTLSRKFKEQLGMNYVRFLRALRITKSLELMGEEKYNMYEIAMLVGYNSLSSFSNIFKRVTGISPTDYQQRLKSK